VTRSLRVSGGTSCARLNANCAECGTRPWTPSEHREHLWGGGVEARQVERVWVAGVSNGEAVAHHADHHQLRLDAGGRAVLLQSHLGMHRTEPRLAVCVDNETVDGGAILPPSTCRGLTSAAPSAPPRCPAARLPSAP
jgi:hypothetical protein